MLRILELLGGFGIGGSERAAQILMECSDPSRFRFLAVGFRGGGPRMEALRRSGIHCEVADGDVRRLAALMEDYRPHVLHLHRGGEATAFSRAVLDLASERDVAVVETNIFGRVDGTAPDRRVLRRGHMSLSSMLKYARAAGRTVKQLYEEGHRAIYNAVPVRRWGPPESREDEGRRLRARCGVGPDEVVGLRVGRPDLRKWSALLETAVPLMMRANPALKIMFRAIPEGPRKALKRRFGDRIIALRVTADERELAATYAAADLMVHSSHIGESFGCVLAEAMYWRLPVVVDSTPSMDNAQVEVVDNGVTGLVVDGPFAFADAVGRLCRDARLRGRMGRAGHRKVLEQFADEVVARQWERAFVEAALEHGVDVEDGLVDYAAALPQVPAPARHREFGAEYERRLGDVFPPQRRRPTLQRAGVRAAVRGRAALRQLQYSLEVGPRRAARRAWHRIMSVGNPFRRT